VKQVTLNLFYLVTFKLRSLKICLATKIALRTFGKPVYGTHIMSIAISNLNPTSRGTVFIAHSDPEAYPTIDLNPLADNDDLNFMVDKYIETVLLSILSLFL
jgi:hypothetical protein